MALLFSLMRFFFLLSALIGLCLLSACSSLFFYPQKQIVATPDQAGVAYEEISLRSRDGTRLSAWLLKSSGLHRGTVYFLHGNAENISTHFASVHWLPEQGYDVLMLDYRGYGHSEGEPELPEIYEDIEAGFQWLLENRGADEPLYFLGQSIGAALGVYWMAYSPAAQQRLHKAVLDAPFSSFPAMIEDVLERHWLTWLLAEPVSWGFSSRYDPDKAAASIPAGIHFLCFHSTEDRVVPIIQGASLYRALPASTIRVETRGPHIATFYFQDNRNLLLNFLQQ